MWVDHLRQVRRLIARNRLGVALVTGFMGTAVGSTAAVVALLHAFVFNQVPSGRGAETVHVIGLAFRTPGEGATSWWRRAPSLDRLASYVSAIAEVDSPEGWRPVRATVVSADFFAVFAANPLSGRFFQPSDEDAAPLGAAVISREFWKGYGASRPSIIGEQLWLGDTRYLIVGIAPGGFDYPSGTEVWTSGLVGGIASRDLRSQPRQAVSTGPGAGWVARLKPGASAGQARGELDALLQTLNQRDTSSPSRYGEKINVVPLHEMVARDVRPALLALLAGAILVLSISSINGGVLLSVYAAARRKDIAIRLALGASPRRLIQSALAECVVLWAITTGVALLVSLVIVSAVRAYSTLFLVHTPLETSLTGTVLAASGVLATMAVGIAVIIPALQVRRIVIVPVLQGNPVTWSRSGVPLRPFLLAAETCLALMLTIAAMLSTRTWTNLASVDIGFDPRQAVVVQVRIREPTSAAYLARQAEILRRLGAIPGMQRVGAASDLPIRRSRAGSWIEHERVRLFCSRYLAAGDYLAAMGIPLLAGRSIRDGEHGVAVVGQRVAQTLWPGANALGERLSLDGEQQSVQVIGIAKDTIPLDVGAATDCQIYVPYGDVPPGPIRAALTPVVARCAGRCPEGTIALVRQRLATSGDSYAGRVSTLQSVVDNEMAPVRFRALLSVSYAALGAALAFLGTYALTSYLSMERSHDVGIHMSIGARPGDIVAQMLSEHLRSILAGVVLGSLASFALARSSEGLLFGVKPFDPMTFVIAAALLIACGASAAAIPAIRLARRTPADLLQLTRAM